MTCIEFIAIIGTEIAVWEKGLIVISYSDLFGKTSYNLFFDRVGREITDIGYDDFSVVAPQTLPRVQGHSTLHYILEGKGEVFIGDTRFELGAGEGFVLPSGVQICYYPKKEDPWRYVWFGVDGEFSRLLGEAGFSDTAAIFRPSDTEETAKLLADMILRVRGDSLSDYLYAKSVFLRLLSDLTVELDVRERDLPPPHRAVIGEIMSLIEQNYASPSLSVDMLCRIVHISHSYLCKIFLRETGFTMRQVITNKRLAEAKKRLSDGMGIRETAEAVGYRDIIHFSKEFRKYTGMPPGAYRAQK